MEAVSQPLQYGGCCPCSKRSGHRFHSGWGCFVGFIAVALFAFSARAEWKFYPEGKDGNPTNINCITDGNWILQTTDWWSGDVVTITIGNSDYNGCVIAGSGVLDFRGQKITRPDTGKVYDKISLRGYAFYKCSTLTEFYADNISSLGGSAFFNSSVKNVEVGGTFASLGANVFYCSLTNLVVNSKNFNAINGQTFGEGKKLKTISITTTNAVSVSAESFQYEAGALKTLTVNGPAWTQTALDNLLAKHSGADGSTAEKAAKPCTIYVDKSMGWDGTGDYAQGWSPSALTDAEKAVKPKKCFGVYVTAAGARKA